MVTILPFAIAVQCDHGVNIIEDCLACQSAYAESIREYWVTRSELTEAS